MAASPAAADRVDPPNILLIMADDVGIEGLGCYGGTSYRTPNLDRMAANGVRFTHAYSQPLCTPTRVQLMTGLYNHRNWRAFGILDPGVRTFGHALQDAGYTTGIFGKWQLQSYDPPDFPGAATRRGTGMHAKDAGFDRYALFHALDTEDKGSRYANPTMLEGTAGQPGRLRTYAGRYGADVWVDQILDFMDQTRDEPTFVYYPMALPHWPFQPTPDSVDWNPERQPQPEGLEYQSDMIEYMDTAVGRLVDGLADRTMLSDTVVIFYSDNGTHLSVTSKMADGRTIAGGKATPRQTGIHVPLIVRWEGRLDPRVCDDLVDASDFFPTLLELAGVSEDQAASAGEAARDGISFVPSLFDRPGQRREAAFFWYDPRPGWDKDRFDRHVFAVNRTHKYFRDGRLYRLGPLPLSERLIPRERRNETDREASQTLAATIDRVMGDVEEPPLVDAYGEPTER